MFPTKVVIVAGAVTKIIYGSVIFTNLLIGPAPSISALSYSSYGMFIRTQEKVIMV